MSRVLSTAELIMHPRHQLSKSCLFAPQPGLRGPDLGDLPHQPQRLTAIAGHRVGCRPARRRQGGL